MTSVEPIYTTAQVADMLGISVPTLLDKINAAEIAACAVGNHGATGKRRWVILHADLMDYLKSNRQRSRRETEAVAAKIQRPAKRRRARATTNKPLGEMPR